MTVYKHQGKWRFEFWKNGIKHRKGGYETREQAKFGEVEVRKNLKRINMDFIKLCESRLEELELKRTAKHFKENKQLITNLVTRWGNKKEITRDDAEAYIKEIARKSRNKANKHIRLVKALFGHGVKRGWLLYNPVTGIERYPVTPKKRYIPSKEDLKKVLSVAKSMDRLYLLTVAHTMGRITAINQLKWEDVHFEESYVSLFTRKAKNSDLKEIRIPMNSVLRSALEQIPNTSAYVFVNPDTGNPFNYRSKFLRTLCKKAQVKYFSFHALRHFGASLLDNEGVALTDIQKILGHERATTTDHYLQSLRGSAKEAIKKLEDLQ